MIDWHCHVLPKMDDGSRSIEESVSLIGMQASQGIDTVIATPHFYANDESINSFLSRRKQSYQTLSAHLPADSPKIMLGAEVRYYQGISRMADIRSLAIEDSKWLLLEMPTAVWTEFMIRELIELSANGSIQIVLAHIERYLGLQDKAVWERIGDSGILMQVNAGFFTSFATKRKAVSLLEQGRIHLVGSDCHNLTSRPPQIGKAYEVIQKKLGEEFLTRMNGFGHELLATINNSL